MWVRTDVGMGDSGPGVGCALRLLWGEVMRWIFPAVVGIGDFCEGCLSAKAVRKAGYTDWGKVGYGVAQVMGCWLSIFFSQTGCLSECFLQRQHRRLAIPKESWVW